MFWLAYSRSLSCAAFSLSASGRAGADAARMVVGRAASTRASTLLYPSALSIVACSEEFGPRWREMKSISSISFERSSVKDVMVNA